MWFIGVEVEQETSAPPPKKNPGSAPAGSLIYLSLGRKVNGPAPGTTSFDGLVCEKSYCPNEGFFAKLCLNEFP